MGTLSRYHAENLPALLDKISKNSIGMDDYLNRFWETYARDHHIIQYK